MEDKWNIPPGHLFKTIKECVTGGWRWSLNSKCKYITIRIDMRDGMCLLMDRHGNEITLDDLKYQYQLPGKSDE